MSAGSHTRAEVLEISLLCGLAVLSDLSYAGLTPLVVAYDESLHLDLTTAGWLASAEGAGFTLGALLAAIGGRLFTATRRRVGIAFLVLAVAQLLSAAFPQTLLLGASRAVSGVAAGLIYALGMSAVAASRHSERGFALYFGAIFLSGVIALGIIPTALKWVGLRGFYVAYAAALLVGTLLVRWYPEAAPADGRSPDGVPGPSSAGGGGWRAPSLLLASIVLNFIFNGGLWVLAEHFGLQIEGTDSQSLGALLAGTMLFGLVGTALATVVAQRWAPLRIIVTGNLGLVASVMIMANWHTVAGLIAAMALLNMSVTFLTPATFTALAAHAERGAQWGNLASQAGYSLGPAAIAFIATRSGMEALVAISVGGFLGSAALAWLGLAGRGRHVPSRA